MGDSVEYITMDKSGSNALDFHIAYYLGVLSQEVPAPAFRIISKDAGFDPLIRHLRRKNLVVTREGSIGPKSVPQTSGASPKNTKPILLVRPVAKQEKGLPSTKEANVVAAAGPVTAKARVQHAVAHLEKLKKARPAALKTLRSTLHTLFKKELSDVQLSALCQSLTSQGIIKVEGKKVSYTLPVEV
jgi:hypothetical protein